MGTQLLSVALLAVTVNMVIFIISIYSYLIFVLPFFFFVGGCTGPARGPCECIHISRNGTAVMVLLFITLYSIHYTLIMEKIQYPFFISTVYLLVTYGCLVVILEIPGGVYVPATICFFLLYIEEKIFWTFF